jgi:ABC-2 type transport system ATP-binding protein
LFDEPVNGLDPDGIRWVRNLLRGLAADGRTVFVSSHLMSEMALTAQEVVVIGRGRLIAQMNVEELTTTSTHAFVRVRSPELSRLVGVLERAGARTSAEADGSISVRSMTEERIGDLALEARIALHELAPQSASLEEAFMELTGDSVEYRGGESGIAPTGGTPT